MAKKSSDQINAEIIKLFPLWRRDGLEPLTSIIGYATLLLDGNAGSLIEQQKQFITTIRNVAMRAATSWHNPSDYIKLCFDFEGTNWKWESVQLSEVCNAILSNSFKYITPSNVQIYTSGNLEPVRADKHWLSIAFLNLLEPPVGYFYNYDFPSSISMQKVSDNQISVIVRTGLELPIDEIKSSIESVSSLGNNLNVASIILEKHGSQLEFKYLKKDGSDDESQGTEFEFMLPVWQ